MRSSSTVIAEERDVRHGGNGFYSLRLRSTGPNALRIEVDMSIYFDFVANTGNPAITWTQSEKDAFAREWRRQVSAVWDHATYIRYRDYDLSLIFNFDIRTAAADTQWQAQVMKLKDRSAFRTSAVCRGCYAGGSDARFDSNDDMRKPIGNRTQTAMIHEFGHMIGKGDEYKSTSAHYGDKTSIMNIGSAVRDRHLQHFIEWAEPHIDRLPRDTRHRTERMTSMAIQHILASADSIAAEIAAAQGWRDDLGPDEKAHFTLRHRETHEPVAVDEVLLDEFAQLEVVFLPSDEEDGRGAVWQPKSREALEILFLE